jgi:hypothetical protein
MPVVTIHLDHELHGQLKLRAAGAGLSMSAFLRPLIEDAAFPGGRYVYTTQDELIGIAIQTFVLVAELAGANSPALVERGMANARLMLRDRGLLKPEDDPLRDLGRITSTRGGRP